MSYWGKQGRQTPRKVDNALPRLWFFLTLSGSGEDTGMASEEVDEEAGSIFGRKGSKQNPPAWFHTKG